MFADVTKFDSDLNRLDVSNVENMYYKTKSFKSDISKWDIKIQSLY